MAPSLEAGLAFKPGQIPGQEQGLEVQLSEAALFNETLKHQLKSYSGFKHVLNIKMAQSGLLSVSIPGNHPPPFTSLAFATLPPPLPLSHS